LRLRIGSAALAIGVFCAAGSLWAHHSTTAEFDVSKRFTLAGTLTKVDWVNPHIVIYMNAKSNSAKTSGGAVEEWKFETNPPAWFKRVGVNKSDFSKGIGQSVTVEGNRAKDESNYGYLLKITFADGNSLELVSGTAADGQK
jgi:hypothetical protein